jgi:hypothetical protein
MLSRSAKPSRNRRGAAVISASLGLCVPDHTPNLKEIIGLWKKTVKRKSRSCRKNSQNVLVSATKLSISSGAISSCDWR